MIITGALILLLAAVIFFYMRQPQFGKTPSGESLARIERSPHYKNGRFHNLVEKPTVSEGYSTSGEIYNTFFKEYPGRSPIDSLPSVRNDLIKTARRQQRSGLVWPFISFYPGRWEKNTRGPFI